MRETINDLKSDAMKSQVPIPRLLIIPGGKVNTELFGSARPSNLSDLERSYAQEIAGAPLGDSDNIARAMCVGHLLSHSQLGAQATPKSYRGTK